MKDQYFGSSKINSPDPIFRRNVEAIAEQARSTAESMLKGKARSWETALHKGDPAHYESVRESFSREGLDLSYQNIYNPEDPGADGEARAVKLQAAYLQSMERGFRLRHCSLIRSEAFAAGRRLGHANPSGPLLEVNGVLGYITKLIELSKPADGG